MDQPEKGKGKGGKGGKGKGKRKDGPLARLEMTGGGKLNWDLEDDVDVGDAADDDITVPVEHTGIHFPLLEIQLNFHLGEQRIKPWDDRAQVARGKKLLATSMQNRLVPSNMVYFRAKYEPIHRHIHGIYMGYIKWDIYSVYITYIYALTHLAAGFIKSFFSTRDMGCSSQYASIFCRLKPATEEGVQ